LIVVQQLAAPNLAKELRSAIVFFRLFPKPTFDHFAVVEKKDNKEKGGANKCASFAPPNLTSIIK